VTVVVVVFVCVVFVLLTAVLVVVEPGTLFVAVAVVPGTNPVFVVVTVFTCGTRTIFVFVKWTVLVRRQMPE
jgi:hypothetical protein